MDTDRQQRLADFVQWCEDHITGDEKGQAQVFLDHLFRAFGQPGVLDVGANYEERVKKTQSGTAFADLVWKPHVLIEMKKRGTDLATAYQQAFEYWTRLVPGRPHYVILCNFDEFRVYDFDIQVDEPVDQVALKELPDRFGPLAFLFPTEEEPTFGNNNEQVTRDAAALLGQLFNKLATRRDVGRETAQRFVLQLLVALFAEDIGLLGQYTVESIVRDADTPERAHDLFLDLFRAMNEPTTRAGGRFKGIAYFNGGLYADPVSVEMSRDELNLIWQPHGGPEGQGAGAAGQDWSKVRPEIFGTIFEQTCDQDERHAFGAHFTAGLDIKKIIKPTITDPWQQAIDKARTVGELEKLRNRMYGYRVLDPACGSGNFLYLAYRELKRLERELLDKLDRLSKRTHTTGRLGGVTARQFFGMDINPFAVELAKVTMMIARKLAIDELHMDEQALPLDNLDANFRVCDALISDVTIINETNIETGNITKHQRDARYDPSINYVERAEHLRKTTWPEADAIIGNPPFLGAKLLKPERGGDYVEAIRRLYPEVPGMADYCVYWFRRAHDHLPPCTPDDPLRGRAGLVGTQNIRNNKSREGGLDYILASGGTMVEAVDNQPWSGEANVHVSIANWVKHAPAADPAPLLIPPKKKLWFRVDQPGKKTRRKRGDGPATKQYELSHRETEHINAALSDQAMVSTAQPLKCVTQPQCSFQGVKLGYAGFQITHATRREMIAREPRYAEVAKPWIIGRDLLTGDGTPSRSVIDFAAMDQFDARSYDEPFAIVEREVLPDVQTKAEEAANGSMAEARREHLNRWWQFWNVRHDMRQSFEDRNRFIACSQVTKRPIFCFVSTSVTPDATLQVWTLDDDYSFGVIQSGAHWAWFYANCSKLESRLRYTRRSVWDTFPWPQGAGDKDVLAVAEAGRAVRRVRTEALTKIKGGLRALYRTLELPGKSELKDAHAALDAAVLKAYGFSARKDLLEQLLDLNHAVAKREASGEPVVGPGIPAGFRGDRAALVTEDCVSE